MKSLQQSQMMLERQREGISKAKAEGKYKGRKPVPAKTIERVNDMVAEGRKPSEIAKELSLGRSTVYRILQRAS